ncbi:MULTISPECIES: restriction endonuclease [Streptomyces]|uniref:restriction endonuclease n=1 Tax=Streptomyces TaxID=1883 RepID=UPI001E380161|nr:MULTISPECIES: restriction endonuclease [Streptomyces]UFQ13873.1 restriction endonuclease [Streptomyces huasconensis]WCL83471.1 restriction endonuclease [Streptomyces sp. JCM 35825]
MTVPSRPAPRVAGERRFDRFDLRANALFFVLLAIILCVMAFLVRTAADIVESRPLWAGVLVVVALATVPLGRSRWRRFSAARYARRAAEVLEEAAEQASESLGAAEAEERAVRHGEESTAVLAPPLAPDAAYDCDHDYAALDADGFEEAIAQLCSRDACQAVEVVGGACDLGADVLAVTADGRRVVIQCKRYGEGNRVGSQDLQRFGGTCFTVHEADVAALVTTSDFTAPALEYAQQCGIVCVNGEELEAWRDGTGPSPWERMGVEA